MPDPSAPATRPAGAILEDLAQLGKQAAQAGDPSEVAALEAKILQARKELEGLTAPGGPLPGEAREILSKMAGLAEQTGRATSMRELFGLQTKLDQLGREFEALGAAPVKLPEAAAKILDEMTALAAAAVKTDSMRELLAIQIKMEAAARDFEALADPAAQQPALPAAAATLLAQITQLGGQAAQAASHDELVRLKGEIERLKGDFERTLS